MSPLGLKGSRILAQDSKQNSPSPSLGSCAQARPHHSPQAVAAVAMCLLPGFSAPSLALSHGPQSYSSLAPQVSPNTQAGVSNQPTQKLCSFRSPSQPSHAGCQQCRSVSLYVLILANHLWRVCFLPLPKDRRLASSTCVVHGYASCWTSTDSDTCLLDISGVSNEVSSIFLSAAVECASVPNIPLYTQGFYFPRAGSGVPILGTVASVVTQPMVTNRKVVRLDFGNVLAPEYSYGPQRGTSWESFGV